MPSPLDDRPPGVTAGAEPAATIAGLLTERDDVLTGAVLEAVRTHLGMDVALLSEFAGEEQVFHAAQGEAASFGLAPGARIPLEESYCPRMVRGALPNALPDVRADPLTRDLRITAAGAIGAYVGVPVRLADGELYGTLCALNHTGVALGRQEVRVMRMLAAIIADHLSRHPDRDPERRREADAVRRALADGIAMAFQPIVRLEDGRSVGAEALARFHDDGPPRSPDAWFTTAWDIGHGEALELLAIRTALDALEDLPPDMYLAVNADPRTVQSGALRDTLERHEPRRLVVELTEHAPVAGYGALGDAMAALRRQGVRFAVDDAGAGYAGLSHLLRVSPDVIKLDRFLTAGVDADPARRALIASAATFASATGTRVVAEGIETESELRAVRASGIRYGQGYHFGRPGDLDGLRAG